MEAATTGGVGLQILRGWILRFNADGPEGLKDRWAKGFEPKLSVEQRSRLIQAIEAGHIPAIHGVVRWRIIDLAGWLYDEYGVSISTNRLSRIVNDLSYRKLSARPKHHGQNELALEAFKKNLPANLARIKRCLPAGTELEICRWKISGSSCVKTGCPTATIEYRCA